MPQHQQTADHTTGDGKDPVFPFSISTLKYPPFRKMLTQITDFYCTMLYLPLTKTFLPSSLTITCTPLTSPVSPEATLPPQSFVLDYRSHRLVFLAPSPYRLHKPLPRSVRGATHLRSPEAPGSLRLRQLISGVRTEDSFHRFFMSAKDKMVTDPLPILFDGPKYKNGQHQ